MSAVNAESRKPSTLLAASFFVAFLLVQLGVPALKLAEPRPARFGWQMYAGTRAIPGFSVVLPEGGEKIRTADHVIELRREIDNQRLIPPHLCRTVDSASAVLLHRSGQQPETYSCSR